MFSIKFKIIIANTLIFGIILVLSAFFIYKNTEKNSIDKMTNNLLSYSKLLREEIEEQLSEDDTLNIKELKKIRPEGLYDVKIRIYDRKHDRIVSDISTNYNDTTEIKNSFSGKPELRKLCFKDQKYYSYWHLVKINNDTLFVLQTLTSFDPIGKDLDRLEIILFSIVPFALIFSGVSAFYISKKAFRPIVKMINTAQIININNLNQKLQLPKRKDEVYHLAETLNGMISRLEKSFESQKQFITDASHQLRTPLTIIQSEIELALKNLSDEDIKETLKNTLSELENLNSLADSLLTISKMDTEQYPLKIQNIRIDELVMDCVQSMKSLAFQKNIQFNILINEPIEIKIDEEKIKIAILNLLDNAVKYSQRENESLSNIIKIELGNYDNDNIFFSIEDNGLGIMESDILKIFDRFFRSNEVRSEVIGNGLGLSIVKSIIDMHSGSIKVESKYGEGSKFILILKK